MSKLKIAAPQVSEKTADLALAVLGVGIVLYALYLGGVFRGRDAKIIEFPKRPTENNSVATNSDGDKG